MRKELIVFLVLFGVFLAIGCAETKKTSETATPAKEVTPVTTGNNTGMMKNTSGMMNNNTGMMKNTSGMMNNNTEMMKNTSGMMNNNTGMMGNKNR